MPAKRYDAGRYAQRYASYRRSFVAACFLFLIAYLLGAVLWSRLSLTSFGESLIQNTAGKLIFSREASFWQGVLSVLFSRLVLQLVLFLLGITVYAPLAWGGVMLWLGLSGGMGLGFLFRFASLGVSPRLVTVEILFSLACAMLTASYASFVLCVYKKQMGQIPDTDSQMFGGTLFCASFYRKRINLRFWVLYQLVFLATVLVQGALALLYRCFLGIIIG